MRTTYSNTRHPKFAKYSVIAGFILCIVCFVLYATIDEEAWYRTFFHTGWFCIFYASLFGGSYLLMKVTVDEEADTITSSEQKKYPMKISKENADLIVAQLTKVKPSIEIKHANYI